MCLCKEAQFAQLVSSVALTLVYPHTDVSDIKFVINFDFPNNTEDYIHRIGRTARAKNTGTAYSFFTKSNAKQAKDLIEIIKEAKQPVSPRLYEMMDLAKQMMHFKRESVSLVYCHTQQSLLYSSVL